MKDFKDFVVFYSKDCKLDAENVVKGFDKEFPADEVAKLGLTPEGEEVFATILSSISMRISMSLLYRYHEWLHQFPETTVEGL